MLPDFIFDDHNIPTLTEHLWDATASSYDDEVVILLAFDEHRKWVGEHILAINDTIQGGDDPSAIITDFLKAHGSTNLMVAVSTPGVDVLERPTAEHFDIANRLFLLSQNNDENYKFSFRGLLLLFAGGGGFLSPRDAGMSQVQDTESVLEAMEAFARTIPEDHFIRQPLERFVMDAKLAYAAQQVKTSGGQPDTVFDLPTIKPLNDRNLLN